MSVEIREVPVKEFLGISSNKTLSPKSADMGKIYDYCKAAGKSVIIKLSFKGVNCGYLCSDERFKELLLNPDFNNVFIEIHNNATLYKTCRMLVMLGRKQSMENKVKFIEDHEQIVSGPEAVLKPSVKSEAITNVLLSRGLEVNKDDGLIIIHYAYNKDVTVLSAPPVRNSDIAGIYNAIVKAHEQTGFNRAVVDFTGFIAFSDQASALTDILYSAKERLETKYNIKLTVWFGKNDVSSKNQWSQTVSMKQAVTDKAKKLEIMRNMETNLPGILAEFVPDENKLNRLGQYGKGQVSTRTPVIFRGVEGENLKFTRFDGNTFLRRADWFREQMIKAQEQAEVGEAVSLEIALTVKSNDISIPIEDVGFARKFVGSRFHFALPVQDSEDGYMAVYAWSKKNQQMETVQITLPDWFMLILDENGISYNRAELSRYIGISERLLRERGLPVPQMSDYNFARRN